MVLEQLHTRIDTRWKQTSSGKVKKRKVGWDTTMVSTTRISSLGLFVPIKSPLNARCACLTPFADCEVSHSVSAWWGLTLNFSLEQLRFASYGFIFLARLQHSSTGDLTTQISSGRSDISRWDKPGKKASKVRSKECCSLDSCHSRFADPFAYTSECTSCNDGDLGFIRYMQYSSN